MYGIQHMVLPYGQILLSIKEAKSKSESSYWHLEGWSWQQTCLIWPTKDYLKTKPATQPTSRYWEFSHKIQISDFFFRDSTFPHGCRPQGRAQPHPWLCCPGLALQYLSLQQWGKCLGKLLCSFRQWWDEWQFRNQNPQSPETEFQFFLLLHLGVAWMKVKWPETDSPTPFQRWLE